MRLVLRIQTPWRHVYLQEDAASVAAAAKADLEDRIKKLEEQLAGATADAAEQRKRADAAKHTHRNDAAAAAARQAVLADEMCA